MEDKWMTDGVTSPYDCSMWRSIRNLWLLVKDTNLTEEQDRLIWEGERKGEFTVRSAYRELRPIVEQQAGWP